MHERNSFKTEDPVAGSIRSSSMTGRKQLIRSLSCFAPTKDFGLILEVIRCMQRRIRCMHPTPNSPEHYYHTCGTRGFRQIRSVRGRRIEILDSLLNTAISCAVHCAALRSLPFFFPFYGLACICIYMHASQGLVCSWLVLLLHTFLRRHIHTTSGYKREMSSSRGVGKAAGRGGAGTPHVLAVDDSSVDRAVIAGILRSSRFRVTAVDSGKRALELLVSEPNVSMIITDYWMPEMTGYELLKKVKGSSELRQIPVVIMSSENVPTRINRCLEEGAEDFLVKPIRPSDISRIFSRVLN